MTDHIAVSGYLNRPLRSLAEVQAAQTDDAAMTAFLEASERVRHACARGMAVCREAIDIINADRAARGVPPLGIGRTVEGEG